MKMNEVMNYLLEWTLKQCQGGENSLYSEHVCSSEVYDRAISIIGIVVPCSVWLLACFAVALLLFGFLRLFGGGKRG